MAKQISQSAITTVGTVTTGNVTAILPTGVLSGSLLPGSNVTINSSSDGFFISSSAAGGGANDATITLTAGSGLDGGGAFTVNQSGNEEITIDIYPDITASLKNLEGFSFLPSSFSANPTSGERKEIPFCISFPTGTEATQGSVTFFSTATKNDGESWTKTAGQSISIRFFADLSVSPAKSKYEYCQSTNANTNFTISDAGNGGEQYF